MKEKTKIKTKINIYFSDFFNVTPEDIEKYGAFDISLINDLPLFIDPFLLFNSDKSEYKELHSQIIKYVAFLSERSKEYTVTDGLMSAWFSFPEVKQNWFGYSEIGNGGSGLGMAFARSLNQNLNAVFTNFGSEQITQGSHLEKLCLIKDGVGKDNISDFTTNLIKKYLLEYTETFAKQHIDEAYLKIHNVEKVEFNYDTRSWKAKQYTLPTHQGDFVLLTPKDILTKDETWINKKDMVADFSNVLNSIPNSQLVAQLSDYLRRQLPDDPNQNEKNKAIVKTITHYPQYMDYFIKLKEDNGDQAIHSSSLKVGNIEDIFVNGVRDLATELLQNSQFYQKNDLNSFDESYSRVCFLKQIIEHNDGYRFFYIKDTPIKREQDLQLLFKLTWFATSYDVNAEVNNGRGPVDFKISKGKRDKSLVEFKLASNSKLKANLKNQVQVYEAANETKNSIKVILYFNDHELSKIINIMNELKIKEDKNFVLIDARPEKVSASNVV